MFLENSNYNYWILHKKLVLNEIGTSSVHISFNFDHRMLNHCTPDYPFPLAGHTYILSTPDF